MSEYVPVSANQEHTDRHFAGSLVPGSKFLPMDEAEQKFIIDTVDQNLADRFQTFLDQGQEPSRLVFQIEFPQAIGTDALVEIPSGQEQAFTEVTRDVGQPHESKVKILESKNIPETNIVTIVAGAYGPTGKWGIYTMFPGKEAPAFPNKQRQNEEDFAANTKFWNNHGFLASAEEVKFSLPQATKSLEGQALTPGSP